MRYVYENINFTTTCNIYFSKMPFCIDLCEKCSLETEFDSCAVRKHRFVLRIT